jgi:hypothetical protein
MHGSQAVNILEMSRKSSSWKRKGLFVGEIAYRITIPSNKKSTNKTVAQESKSDKSKAISIPDGKYLTIAQVAEICAVQEKTVSGWLDKGLLKGLELPGLGGNHRREGT